MKAPMLLAAGMVLLCAALQAAPPAPAKAPARPAIQKTEFEVNDSVSFYLKFTSPQTVDLITEDMAAADPKDRKNIIKPKRFTLAFKPQRIEPIKSAAELFGGKKKAGAAEPVDAPNHIIAMRELGIDYFIRPNVKRYTEKLRIENQAAWDKLPDAMGYRLFFDFRKAPDGVRLYIDGKYAACFKGDNRLKKIVFSGVEAPKIEEFHPYSSEQTSALWEVMDLSFIGNAGAMAGDAISLRSGERMIGGVPVHVLAPDESCDIGKAKSTRGIYVLEVDLNLSRTAFERLPEAFITSVPNGYYSEAAVLFSLDPDPKKDRAMTLRLTRFCSEGRGEPHIHVDVDLPPEGAPMPENIKRVGTVKHKTADGKTIDLPLYLGRFPLNSGEIIDLINDDPHPIARHKISPYLDFEIFARRGKIGAYVTGELKPAGNVVSAVNVFGASLRRASMELRLIPSVPGHVFTDEKPETTVSVTAVRDASCTLAWVISDTFGRPLRREEVPLTLKAGETKEIKVSLDAPDIGHYLMDFSLSENGGIFLTHHAMFALTGPDTREASRTESPFGCWWFAGPHHCSADPELCFNLMHKAGIRKTSLRLAFRSDKPSPAAVAAAEKYQMTLMQFASFGGIPIDNPEEAEKILLKHYAPLVKAFPDCKQALVLHESYGDPMPPELLGQPPPNPAPERDVKITKRAEIIAKFFRKHYPDIKLCFGNNTSSSGVMATLFRNGLDPKLVDYIGIETPGQGCIPERLWRGGTQGTWFARETAKHFGYDIPVTGCYEFTARPLRLFEMHKHAEYKIRDALVGLSHGFNFVSFVGLSDCANGYIQTIWGTGGMFTRNPLHYPRPLFSACAALTRVLDRIEYRPKILDTGANTTYALEFKRRDGRFAYACWVPVGKAEIRFEFPAGTAVEQVGFLGKTTKTTVGTLLLPVSTSPCYLVTSAPASAAVHVRTLANSPRGVFTIAEKLDNLNSFRIMSGVRNLNGGDLFRLPGKFEFKRVKDPDRGDCVEIKLVKDGAIRNFESEYTKIQFKKPRTIHGTPDGIGLWVKGDGGWGKITFEIQDATGKLFYSDGTWNDFGAETFIAFTGWRFISFPLDGEGVKKQLNQSLGNRWNSAKLFQYPIKINGLYITLPRRALNPGEMKDVPGVIRIQNLGTIVNPANQLEKTERNSK